MCAYPVGIPSLFVSTGLVPLAAVEEVAGPLPLPVLPLPEVVSEEPSPPPLFAKAIAAMRRTTTPTTVTRLREEDRPPRREAPPYGSPSGSRVRVWPVSG